MNFRDLLSKGETAIAKIKDAIVNALEGLKGKITAGTETLIPEVSNWVDAIQKAARAVETELPIITADLNGPVGSAIAAAIPSGTVLKDETIAIINRFQPYLQKAADKAVMNALKLRLTAEIVFVEHGAIATIDKAILDVQYCYQAVAGLEGIPLA